MGWLVASIFFGIIAFMGLTVLIVGEIPEGELIPDLIIIVISACLCLYFRKRYMKRDPSNWKGNYKLRGKPQRISKEDEKILELEDRLPVIEESPIYLKGDVLHYLEPATLLITKNKMVGRTGKTGGISVRLAKGIYARTGSYGGTPIYKDVTYTFNGQLAVTNNRILFIHPQKGFEIRLKDISLIDPYSDGVSIQTKSKAYSFMLKEPRYFLALVKKVLENNREALA